MRKNKFLKKCLATIFVLSLFSCANNDVKKENNIKDNYEELLNENKSKTNELLENEEKNDSSIISNTFEISGNDIDNELDEKIDNNTIDININRKISDNSCFEIHFIDVGQGDAALIICDDRYMLIDGGPTSASSLMYTYLKNMKINYLDYVICTHPDEDHVGGISGALNFAGLGVAYCPYIKEEEPYYNFVKYVEKNNAQVIKPNIGDNFELGSAKVEILATNIGSDNDASIITKIIYGNNTFLFMGDAGSEVEDYLIKNYSNLKCDLIKVGHHGSEYSTGYQFLYLTEPSYAIISVGEGNSFGHPTGKVLSKLKDADVKTYRTDIHGDIVCISDGNNITINVEKNPLANPYENLEQDTVTRNTTKTNDTDHSFNEYTYCINISTKKFHYSYCSSVDDMKDKNKKYTNEDRNSIISQGYKPCKRCNP